MPRPTPIDYGLYIGLWLNLSRVRLQGAYATLRGLQAAHAKRIPHDIFDAIAANEDEAAEMDFAANVELARQAATAAAAGFLGRT